MSEQVVSTPAWLVSSIAFTWGPIELDPCATAENAKARRFFTPSDDGLSRNWIVEPGNVCYANPPFHDLGKWVQHGAYSAREHGTDVVMLTLASVGSSWWREFVHGKAEVTFTNRFAFDGHAGVFQRDLSIVCFGPKFTAGTYRCIRLVPGQVQDIRVGMKSTKFRPRSPKAPEAT